MEYFSNSSSHNLVRPPSLFSHRQQYVKHVLQRASDEAQNLRADYRLRESIDAFNRRRAKHHTTNNNHNNSTKSSSNTCSTTSLNFNAALRSMSSSLVVGTITRSGGGGGGTGSCSSNGGIVGLVSDLVTISDPIIARALSAKRRAALSTVVVDNDGVLFELRHRDLVRGAVNFLPLSTLHLENTSLVPRVLSASTASPPSAAPPASALVRGRGAGEGGTNGGGAGGRGEGRNEERVDLLPIAPEMPAPAGFVGYAVRLLELRSEHESLRWTVLFTLYKDLVVFETTEQVYG